MPPGFAAKLDFHSRILTFRESGARRSLPLSEPLEIVGKLQPACRINDAASFVRFFPAYLCLPSEPVRIVDVHMALQMDAR